MHGPVRTDKKGTCKVYGITPFGGVGRRSFSSDALVRVGAGYFLLFFIRQDTSRTFVDASRRQVDGTRWPTSGWVPVSQMTEDLVPSGLGRVCFLPTRPWHAASQGVHSGVRGPSEVGYIFILRVSRVVGPYPLSIPDIASGWWLLFLQQASLFTTPFRVLVSSSFGLSPTLTQSVGSPGWTDTPSTRIPHPATL